MDILEPKQKGEFDNELKDIIKILKFKDNPIGLKGSSLLKSQKYFSDYDLFTNIRLNYSIEEIYDEFHKILQNIISNYDLYFIELKLQTKKGEKFKWLPNDEFGYKEFKKRFKNIDFVKIDIISRIKNIFIEVSCNYVFGSDIDLSKTDNSKEIKELEEGIIELKKDNNYYKILKRLFSIFKLKGDINKIKLLSKIFNSEMGEKYKRLSNLETIKLLKENYNDAMTKKKIEINLSDINEPHSENGINNKIKEYKKYINDKAKIIYNELIK
jgi:hypothetical protein